MSVREARGKGVFGGGPAIVTSTLSDASPSVFPRPGASARGQARPKKRTYDAAATRRALLRAAAEAVAESGVEGTRVEEIARRANANTATIFYHFGSKEALCRAALGEVLADLNDGLAARSAPAARSATEPIRGFIEAFCEATSRHPALPRLLLRELLSMGQRRAPPAPDLLAVFSAARQALARGSGEGVLPRVDPWLGTLTLVGAVTFVLATDPLRGGFDARSGSPENGLLGLQDLLIRGLGPGERARQPRRPSGASAGRR